MYILTVETTGRYGSVAVIDDRGEVITARGTKEMSHLREIMLFADECIRGRGIEKKDLTHVAASIGPGSFTGIRIGVVTARTIAQVMDIPCIAVPTLEAMAYGCFDYSKMDCKYVCTAINARRGQAYAAVWQRTETSLKNIIDERQYMMKELLSEIFDMGEKICFTGDGIDAYASMIEKMIGAGNFVFVPEERRYQDAESVAKIALDKVLQGDILTYDKLDPEYMRKSEAEMRLAAGTLSDKIKRL